MKTQNWFVAALAAAIVGTMAFVFPRALAEEPTGSAGLVEPRSLAADGRSVGTDPIMLIGTKETASFPSGGSSSPATFEVLYDEDMTLEVKALAPQGGTGTTPNLTVLSTAKTGAEDYKQTNVSVSVQEGAGTGWVSEIVFLFKESGVVKKIYSCKIVTN